MTPSATPLVFGLAALLTGAAVRAWLLRQGLVEGRDFVIRRYEGATHNEASWRARLDDPLTFLFGRRR
jgi:hypothetical protein